MTGKTDYLPYLFLVGVVAIVAIVALVLNSSGLAGAPIYKVQVGDYQAPCLEEDEANDVFVAGKLNSGNLEFFDYCVEDVLYQYQCLGNNVQFTRPYECPNSCLNGACLK